MAWSIGLNLFESFAEVVAHQDQETQGLQWFTPRQPLLTGLKKFKEQLGSTDVASICVSTKSVQTILERRLGSSPALLVTSGFENWLEMSLPIQQKYFTVQPQRASSPVNRDLVFGVNERTSADGQVEKTVNQEDLEFLVAKLEMNNIKTVALAFLHSHKNPENENATAEFLKERGLKVYQSSQFFDYGNEKNSWWLTLLTAYVMPTFTEVFDDIQKAVDTAFEKNIPIDIVSSTGEIHSPDNENLIFTQFGTMSKLLGKYQHLGGAGVAYFGFEDFQYIPFNQTPHSPWQSDFGWVDINKPSYTKLRIQPTQLVSQTFWGSAGYSDQQSGYEPGPMILGRALSPTFIDVLYLQKRLDNNSVLQNLIAKQAKSRSLESLEALSKIAHDREAFNRQGMLEWLEEMGLMSIVMDLRSTAGTETIHCVGPLAPAIVPQILNWDVKLNLNLIEGEFQLGEVLL